eukprot:TRINITY_DN10458_c0_g1_i1.p1 TRINITY_DN10458_c0_g1~~TRINITY_DN10458_c0_g1_i1.p1  ORF type:complete len:265 (+),score=38.77 TRINITY_DN10458_c0_g1_i1:262-1056(+)
MTSKSHLRLNRPYLAVACGCHYRGQDPRVTTCRVCLRKAGKTKRLQRGYEAEGDDQPATARQEVLPDVVVDAADEDVAKSGLRERHVKLRPVKVRRDSAFRTAFVLEGKLASGQRQKPIYGHDNYQYQHKEASRQYRARTDEVQRLVAENVAYRRSAGRSHTAEDERLADSDGVVSDDASTAATASESEAESHDAAPAESNLTQEGSAAASGGDSDCVDKVVVNTAPMKVAVRLARRRVKEDQQRSRTRNRAGKTEFYRRDYSV